MKTVCRAKPCWKVDWIPEDWDSITSLVRGSDMMLKDATLDLIDNVEISKGRERMLMSLADGKPYRYLSEKIFPAVMRVDYRIEYTCKPLGAAESLQLLRSGKQRALRLNEFFAVAGCYPAGSTEYNDVLDLAARLFPDSPEANINAAAVALSKKELSRHAGIWNVSPPSRWLITIWASSACSKVTVTRQRCTLRWLPRPEWNRRLRHWRN